MKIEKTKTGKWTTIVSTLDVNGTRHWRRFTGRDRAEVLLMANEHLTRCKTYVESRLFGDALARYVDRCEELLSPSTLHGYRSNQRMLMTDYADFCRIPCDRIRGDDVQAIVNDMRKKGRNSKTIANRMGLISAVLREEDCRMPHYRIPYEPQKLRYIPDVDTMKKVSAACTGKYEKMAIPVGLATFGLRRGEICAVTAADLEGNILHVTRSIVQDDRGFCYEKSPKTPQSVRDLVLPDYLVRLIEEKEIAWQGSPNSLTTAWPHFLKHVGVKYFRLHDCRHFFASYCHDILKLSDEQIMKLGGWKTDSVMKSRYRHSIADSAALVSREIGGILT